MIDNLKFRAILARLQEPGSVRSLVLFVFMIRGQVTDNETLESITGWILALIALISFIMPEAPKVDANKVVEAVGKAQDLVQDAKALTNTAAANLQSAQAVATGLATGIGNRA